MDRKNNTIVLMALSVLCVILIVASTLSSSWITPIRNAIGTVLTPLHSAVSELGIAMYRELTEVRDFQTIQEENKQLHNTIDDLMAENTRLEQDNYELERLRALYRLDSEYNKYEKVGARVIAKDSAGWFNIFRIDKGSDDGLAIDMNVMAGGGLVGIVTEVGPDYATVRSIIDDSSRISAMALQSQDACIVAGSLETYDSGRLLLTDILADADVKDGDKIVTSNISSKYLPGLLIGYAAEISIDSNTLTKSGFLVPVAEFDNIQEVLVVTTLK